MCPHIRMHHTLAVLQGQQWCSSGGTHALSIVRCCSVRMVDVNSPRLMKSLLQKPLGGASCCSSLNRVLSTYGKSCKPAAVHGISAGALRLVHIAMFWKDCCIVKGLA